VRRRANVVEGRGRPAESVRESTVKCRRGVDGKGSSGAGAIAGIEDPQARERVEVGVEIEEAPVALGGDDHGGDGALEPGEVLPEDSLVAA
jgi:hypothetical protein